MPITPNIENGKKGSDLSKQVIIKATVKKSPQKNEQEKNSDSKLKKTRQKRDDSTAYQKRNEIFPIVGVGASAGGLESFKRLLIAMPENPGIAFILIQHLDPAHQSYMDELLSRYTKMKVVQIDKNLKVKPNCIYIIAPNSEIVFNNGELILTETKKQRGWRTPIDTFFLSLAEQKKENAIGIILAGTGSDGTIGVKAIKSSGGMAMAQSPSTTQYEGMPASAIATGVIDFVLPIEEMPEVLLKYVKHYYGKYPILSDYSKKISTDLKNIFSILQLHTTHNFRYYKKNVVIRRITRRMSLKQIDKMSDYVSFLRESPAETMKLFNDLLISVT
ncbi:MAG: chemotaxis protein CheB, partial [Chitinispirillia bacterium]